MSQAINKQKTKEELQELYGTRHYPNKKSEFGSRKEFDIYNLTGLNNGHFINFKSDSDCRELKYGGDGGKQIDAEFLDFMVEFVGKARSAINTDSISQLVRDVDYIITYANYPRLVSLRNQLAIAIDNDQTIEILNIVPIVKNVVESMLEHILEGFMSIRNHIVKNDVAIANVLSSNRKFKYMHKLHSLYLVIQKKGGFRLTENWRDATPFADNDDFDAYLKEVKSVETPYYFRANFVKIPL